MLHQQVLDTHGLNAPPEPIDVPEIAGLAKHQRKRAIARLFPLWSDELERELLPLDDELLELTIRSCARIDADRASMRARTMALAFRRLFALIQGWDTPNKDVWLTRMVRGLVASYGVTSLTRCLISLDLYLAGEISLAQLALSRPEPPEAHEEEQ